MKFKILTLGLCALFALPILADDCQQYKNLPVELTLIDSVGLKVDLRADYSEEKPIIDSLWITRPHHQNEVVLRDSIQWGDTLSLDSFIGSMESEFYCMLWMNGCFVVKPFRFAGWCEASRNVAIDLTVINPHKLILQVEDSLTGEIPVVDSMWITSSAFRGFPEALVSGYAQSGDTIDIYPLVGMQELLYLCWIRIGDCILKQRFFFTGEEWDYCLEYHDCIFSANTTVDSVYYGITHTEKFEDFHVDSIWITSIQDTETPLIVSYAQPKEMIDISSLEKGPYYIIAHIGLCTKYAQFYKSATKNTENTETVQSRPYATKFLRDGQLYIQIGDVVYNARGQVIR